MNVHNLIKKLKISNLNAECPCGHDFSLADTLLFDGTQPFPQTAKTIQLQLEENLKLRHADLKNLKNRINQKTELITRSVNVGKSFEKILPTLHDFKWELPDTRFFGDPIDLIAFNGLSRGKLQSIGFIEVKSGKAQLNARQKSIKEAIEDKRVNYIEYK